MSENDEDLSCWNMIISEQIGCHNNTYSAVCRINPASVLEVKSGGSSEVKSFIIIAVGRMSPDNFQV